MIKYLPFFTFYLKDDDNNVMFITNVDIRKLFVYDMYIKKRTKYIKENQTVL